MEVIKEVSLLGLNLFKRIRLSEKELVLKINTNTSDNYFGLYALSKHPQLKFDNFTMIEEKEWILIAKGTIMFTLLSLISRGQLKVSKVQDEFKVAFFTFKKMSYIVNITHKATSNDYFERMVLHYVEEVQREYKRTNSLKRLVRALNNYVLGRDTYKRPSKQFVKKLLLQQQKKISWFNLDISKGIFGLVKHYTAQVDKSKAPNLTDLHSNFINTFAKECQLNYEWREFKTELETIIQKDFQGRKPKKSNY